MTLPGSENAAELYLEVREHGENLAVARIGKLLFYRTIEAQTEALILAVSISREALRDRTSTSFQDWSSASECNTMLSAY